MLVTAAHVVYYAVNFIINVVTVRRNNDAVFWSQFVNSHVNVMYGYFVFEKSKANGLNEHQCKFWTSRMSYDGMELDSILQTKLAEMRWCIL